MASQLPAALSACAPHRMDTGEAPLKPAVRRAQGAAVRC
ncbi:hypothetical protein SAZ_42140 [Streptomyces noursei ZPM]|nr:hypothetical protein SAZ_42140 [Streptomyces noursei ZPM]EPY92441.1 hypothetical protein K530_53210 [Streptomyces noursei CCRC 11814]